MTNKKKRRGQGAQNLIEALLNEKSPKPTKKSDAPTVVKDDSDETDFNQIEIDEPRHFLSNEKKTSSGYTLSVVPKPGSHDDGGETGTDSDEDSPERFADDHDVESHQGSVADPTVRLESRPSSRSTKKKSSEDFAADNEKGHEKTHQIQSSSDDDVDRIAVTEVKSKAKFDKSSRATTHESVRSQGPPAIFSTAEAALKQSESLRIAQSRITELENEVERLRRENEQLATAGETLRRRNDELLSKSENFEIQARESERIFDEEKKVFRGQLQQKERENLEFRGRLEEMETRLESNFKKIRVRERELEHRLEIVKMETATLISTKDKMILDLKRQIDQLGHENDYGKAKTQELFNQFKDKQETIRRVVRALRIALTILEGDEDASPSKKAE